jgi:hypothetical protein
MSRADPTRIPTEAWIHSLAHHVEHLTYSFRPYLSVILVMHNNIQIQIIFYIPRRHVCPDSENLAYI